MLNGTTLRRADVVTGGLLALLGGGVAAGALQMPIGGTYGGVANPWYASPAAFPLFVGILLVAGGLRIATTGLRAAGSAGLGAFLTRAVQAPLRKPSARRGLIVVTLLAGYYLLLELRLFGAQNYTAVSTVFLAVFSLTFSEKRTGLVIAATVLGSAAVAVGVAALFSGPLRVPLP